MKFETTRKAVMNGYWKVIEVGYCGLQDLLYGFLQPIAYTHGLYGWYADIYQMPFHCNVCICTGYRPFGNVHPDYDAIHKCNLQAMSCKTNDEKLALLRQFVEQATGEQMP